MDELIRKLKETRKSLVTASEASLAKSAELLTSGGPAEERAQHDTAFDKAVDDIKAVDRQIARMEEQAQREGRAAASREGDPGEDKGRASGLQVTSEPQVYGQGSGHSYFLDEARSSLGVGDGDGGVYAARDRMSRHEAELRTEMPRRLEERRRSAEQSMDALLSGQETRSKRLGRRERRAYERFAAEGMRVFNGAKGGQEKRFLSRTDGQGGYFVPPLWLIDEYIPYLRAGRTFADKWRNFPLPSGTDSINIPQVILGAATGVQAGDGAPVPSRDMKDSFVNARVMTIAGQQDAAIQLLDQSPIAFDEIIFGDLAADYNMQLSAQLMLGGGFPQLNSLYPTGVLGTAQNAYGFVTQATSVAAGTMWSGAPASFYTAMAQVVSQISRNRFMPPDGSVSNPMAWYALSAATDTTNRPLVVPTQQGPYNALARGDDQTVEGPVGSILGLPWELDPNVPYTFGGLVPPAVGTISNGSTAAIPGSGATALYTPVIAAVWKDLYLWEGEMHSRTLTEVLSGTLQVRFQVYAYAASMANRYQNAAGQAISYGNVNSVGIPTAALSTAGGLSGF